MRRTRLGPAPFPRIEPDTRLLAHLETIEGATSIEAVDARPHIVRFSIGDDRWLIRILSDDQSFDRTRRRHRLLADEGIAAVGIAPIPFRDKSIVRLGSGIAEIVRDLPGRSWMHNNRLMFEGHSLHRPLPGPDGGLAALTQAVAALHLASEQVDRAGVPVLTIADHQRVQRDRWSRLRDTVLQSGVQTVHIGRWLSASERVVYASRDVLAAADFMQDQPLVASHGDLWPTHVLDGPDGIKLVDWGMLRFASPLIEISQLIARFDGWTAAALEEVVESYMGVRPLTADDRRMLPVFGALDLAIETGKLLVTAYIADIDQTSQYAEAARSGAGQMLSSLEAIGWSIRKTNPDSKDLTRESKERARALREPGQKPRPKRQSSKRPKQ